MNIFRKGTLAIFERLFTEALVRCETSITSCHSSQLDLVSLMISIISREAVNILIVSMFNIVWYVGITILNSNEASSTFVNFLIYRAFFARKLGKLKTFTNVDEASLLFNIVSMLFIFNKYPYLVKIMSFSFSCNVI